MSVKPSQKKLDNARAYASQLRDRIRRIELSAKRKGTPEWEAAKADLQDIVEVSEGKVFEMLEGESSDPVHAICELKKIAGQRVTAKMVIETVEKAEELREKLREALKETEYRISAMEAELEASTA